MRFRNHIALISGAGSGIGRATAQIMGAEGGAIVTDGYFKADFSGRPQISSGSPSSLA